jgi:gas vesicle protein
MSRKNTTNGFTQKKYNRKDYKGSATELIVGTAVTTAIFTLIDYTVKGIEWSIKKWKEKIKKEGFVEGVAHEKANAAQQVNQLLEKIRKFEKKFKEQKDFEESAIAMFAVAYSVAGCNSSANVNEIKEVISGELYSKLPASLKAEIEKMKINPPNFNTAMSYVKKVNNDNWEDFEYIIELVINLDNTITTEHLAYREAWRKFRNAA